MSAAAAFKLKIHADAKNLKLTAGARVRFFHDQFVAQSDIQKNHLTLYYTYFTIKSK